MPGMNDMERERQLAFPLSRFFGSINAVIRFMIISDILFQGSVGLLSPIFALYIQHYILGFDALVVAGTAIGIYSVVKSLAQIPSAWVIDRVLGERDDFLFVFWGTIAAGIIPLAYLFTHTPLELYAIQIVSGLIAATTFPSYMAIFTRHVDPGREGIEWGVYYTLVDMMTAFTAVLGGVISSAFGFPALLAVTAGAGTIGALLLYPIRPYMRLPARPPLRPYGRHGIAR